MIGLTLALPRARFGDWAGIPISWRPATTARRADDQTDRERDLPATFENRRPEAGRDGAVAQATIQDLVNSIASKIEQLMSNVVSNALSN